MFESARKEDLGKIAECHRKAFPLALSARLGQKVAIRVMSWYLDSPKRFLFFLGDGEACVGYCGGLINDGSELHGSASGMIQHSFNDLLLALILRPWLWFHRDLRSRYRLIARNIFFKFVRPNKRSDLVRKETVAPHASLIVIGIDPVFQGRGFGSMLLREFEKKSRESGVSYMTLTVMSENIKAISVYKKHGWKLDREMGKSTLMVKYLS